MDNVSHTLVGAALGEAGLKKYTGLGMATLMVAANLPDVDVLAIPLGENLTFRRGWTHGPLGLLVLPVLLTAAIVGFDRWQQRRGTRPDGRSPVRPAAVLALAYIGAATHPLLDWLNTYGIRLLMPFSETWFYGDTLFIIDPWLWLVLAAGIYLAKRRARIDRPRPSRPALIALVMISLYIALMLGGSRVAERLAHDHARENAQLQVDDLMAGPVPVNPFRREIIVETPDAYWFGRVGFLTADRVSLSPDSLLKRDLEPQVLLARQTVAMQDFLYWSRFPFFDVDTENGRTVVRAGDVRFSRRPTGGWAGVSVVVPDGE